MAELGMITSADSVGSTISPQTSGVATAVVAESASTGEAVLDTIELSAAGIAAAGVDVSAVVDATEATTGIAIQALNIIAEQQQYAADLLADLAAQLQELTDIGKGSVVDTVA